MSQAARLGIQRGAGHLPPGAGVDGVQVRAEPRDRGAREGRMGVCHGDDHDLALHQLATIGRVMSSMADACSSKRSASQ